jgi:hypothetical protein
MWRKTAFVTFHGPQYDAALAATEAVQHVKYVSTIPVLCQFSRELIPRVTSRGSISRDAERRVYGTRVDNSGGRGGRGGGRGGGGASAGTSRGGNGCSKDGVTAQDRGEVHPAPPFNSPSKSNSQGTSGLGSPFRPCQRDRRVAYPYFSKNMPRGALAPMESSRGGQNVRASNVESYGMGYGDYGGPGQQQHRPQMNPELVPDVGQEIAYMPVYMPVNNQYAVNSLPRLLTESEYNIANAGFAMTGAPHSLVALSPSMIPPGMYPNLISPPYAYGGMPDFSDNMGPSYATETRTGNVLPAQHPIV